MANWDIFREMENLRREIDDIFLGFGRGRMLEPGFLPGLGEGHYPKVNLSEDQDHVYVQALVPGMDPGKLELSVLKGTLTLSGAREEENGNKKTWHRNERGTGRFLRTVEIPVGVNTEQVKAECKNGVLTVTMPKAERAKAKKITVSAD